MPTNQVSLTINGRIYYGWLSVSIRLGLLTIARAFSVTLTKKASEDGSEWKRISIGDPVEVRIGDDKVLTGFVTKVAESYSKAQSQLTVSGSSKTIDLVDCCVPDGEKTSFKKLIPVEILKALCKPYGIDVTSEVVKQEAINFDISPEERIAEGLQKLLKKHNLLLTDNENGGLVLAAPASAGTCRDAIQLGKNVLSADRQLDGSLLFSRYVILGQGANPLSERPASDNQLKRVATSSAGRLRVKTVVQSGDAIGDQLQARVNMIRDESEAKSEALSYTVQGWRQSNGRLWPVNAYVSVDDPSLGIRSEYLILGAEFSLGPQGMVTKLSLTTPNAFLNTAEPTAQAAVRNMSLGKIGPVQEASWTSK